MTFRSFIFWPHLAAGITAGAVIFIMSVTGVLLTYEKQMLAWADRSARLELQGGEIRLSIGELINRLQSAHAGEMPASIAVAAAPDVPALAVIRQKAWLVDPYTGATLGESAPRLRRFFRVVTDWHRWLAAGGENRAAARAVTGWANVLFLFIVVSGMYLWLPRRWSWRQVKSVALLKRGLAGKARHFNWHNAIGIWSAVPLFFVVISITPISFPWANAALFRMVGEEPPARTVAPPPRQGQDQPVSLAGVDAAWQRAERQLPDWRTISLRVPASSEAPFSFTIDRGTGGQPQLRGTLTVNRATGDERWEPFESQSLGRRVRSIARFLHTGEVLGIVGQTVAGLASLGAAFLVWTGLSLAYRRFFSRARAENGRARVAA